MESKKGFPSDILGRRRAVLFIVECLAAPLASAHQIQ